MKRPLMLASPGVSHETVALLENALEEARRGHAVGAAMVVFCRRRRFYLGVAGEAYRDPARAGGAVSALAAELVQQMRGAP